MFSHKRLVLALVLQGLVYASSGAAVALFLGTRFGVGRAGLVLGLGGLLGRVLSPRLESDRRLTSTRRRAAVAALSGMLFVCSAALAPWWLAVPAMAVATAFNTLVVTVVLHAAGERLPVGSAASMTGQALGLLFSGFAADLSDTALLLICLLLALLVLVVPVVAALPRHVLPETSTGADDAHTTGSQPLRQRSWFFPFLLATMTYGPLAIFSMLTAAAFGPRWVGPAFLAYAAGSWVAASLPRWLPSSERGAALLAAVACAIWVTGLHVLPFALFGRFLSGVLMFLAQGSVLTRVSREGGRPQLSSALAGIGVGTQVAAAWAGFLAEISVSWMAGVSFAAALLLASFARSAPASKSTPTGTVVSTGS